MNISKLSPENSELLSALADSEINCDASQALSQVFDQDDSVPAKWSAYHVIGEVLRSPGSTVQGVDLKFLAALNQRLAKEPMPGSVARLGAPDSALVTVVEPIQAVNKADGQASNDSNFRWKMVAGFACAVAVVSTLWSVNSLTLSVVGPQLAQRGVLTIDAAPQQVVVASPQGLMVRDARLEELLAAHKQLGGMSALPVPSGFLRNAAFEAPLGSGR